jgi:hypothetical protein
VGICIKRIFPDYSLVNPLIFCQKNLICGWYGL